MELPEILRMAKQGKIEADLKPTEDPEKVIGAVMRIFPNARLREEHGRIVGDTNLDFFRELLEKQKIRFSFAEILEKNQYGKTTFIDLNKLAAEAGRIGVDEDFPLGKIRLTLTLEKE
jgi:predicted RNA binding protein with dsRBD fold (UPF0201 family)